VYTVRNASSSPRKLIIEHSIINGAELVEPAKYEEKTPDLYRFAVELPANNEIQFTVIEELPQFENIVIGNLSWKTALGYSTDKRISNDIRSVLKKAADFMKKIDDTEESIRKLERQRNGVIKKQERIRQNLEAAGNQTAQGQQYLSRLVAMDDEIDAMTKSMYETEAKSEALRKEFEEVIGAPLPRMAEI
jgi:predicted RNase H-like nuclease (RuvC/YqgF family)